MAAMLESALDRCFGADTERSMQLIEGAGSGRSWRVSTGGRCIVAKLPESRGGLTAGPALEYEILRSAAAAGVAPQALGYDAATGVLFVAALSGLCELASAQAGQPQVLERVSRSLRALNAIAAPRALRDFDPIYFADAYCTASRSAAATPLRDELIRAHAVCAHALPGSSLCHNDLHAANIFAGEQFLFVDFEYAVRAAPIVDIASYAAFNGLDEAAAWYLAQCCLAEPPFSAEELAAVIRVQQLLGELWEIARSDNNAPSSNGRSR